jgi:transcriptional coactivator HFI1/ADA1
MIESRMLPICFETGLTSGHSSDASQFMAVATEVFVKQFLSSVFDKTRSNGPGSGGSAGAGGGAGWIQTNAYRKQLAKEEEAWLRGDMKRDKSGLLPVEAKAASERGALGLADLRTALEIGDCNIGSMPIVMEQIVFGLREGEQEAWDDFTHVPGFSPKNENLDATTSAYSALKANGINGTLTNGANGHAHDADGDVEMDDIGWEGAKTEDWNALEGLLDSCLAGS